MDSLEVGEIALAVRHGIEYDPLHVSQTRPNGLTVGAGLWPVRRGLGICLAALDGVLWFTFEVATAVWRVKLRAAALSAEGCERQKVGKSLETHSMYSLRVLTLARFEAAALVRTAAIGALSGYEGGSGEETGG